MLKMPKRGSTPAKKSAGAVKASTVPSCRPSIWLAIVPNWLRGNRLTVMRPCDLASIDSFIQLPHWCWMSFIVAKPIFIVNSDAVAGLARPAARAAAANPFSSNLLTVMTVLSGSVVFGVAGEPHARRRWLTTRDHPRG